MLTTVRSTGHAAQGFAIWLAGRLAAAAARTAALRRALSGRSPAADAQHAQEAFETIRRAMLRSLEIPDSPGRAPSARELRIAFRLRATGDLQALWYLRSDLMQILSARDGERVARMQLDAVTTLFDGLLPSGMHSGRAPLR